MEFDAFLGLLPADALELMGEKLLRRINEMEGPPGYCLGLAMRAISANREMRLREAKLAALSVKHREIALARLSAEKEAARQAHPQGKERLVYVLRRRRTGATLQTIGKEIGLSPSRVRQLLVKAERMFKPKTVMRAYRARIQDPDANSPRDVWLTFHLSPDPRLDVMEPVSGEM